MSEKICPSLTIFARKELTFTLMIMHELHFEFCYITANDRRRHQDNIVCLIMPVLAVIPSICILLYRGCRDVSTVQVTLCSSLAGITVCELRGQ